MRWQTLEQHQESARTTQFLGDLPRYVARIARVREAFLRYSGLTETFMQDVVALGNEPRFEVGNAGLGAQSANGKFNSLNKRITIDLHIAVEIERLQALPEGMARVLLYATWLHELVHYGRFIEGLSSTVDGEEAGKLFECEAYRGDISWDGQSGSISQRRQGVYHGISWHCPLRTLTRPGGVRPSWLPPS